MTLARSELEALVKNRLPRIAEELILLFRDQWMLQPRLTADKSIPVGSTKFGGLPDLESSGDWPRVDGDGKPLSLLLQLNFEELHKSTTGLPLPESGLLSFFYDVEDQPWGFDPKDASKWAVVFTESVHELHRLQAPTDLDAEFIVPSAKLILRRGFSLPDPGEEAVSSLKLNDAEFDALAEIRDQAGGTGPRHRLFGYPDLIQNPMELECQLAFHGVYVGDSEGYNTPRAKALASGAVDWRLLLQFDSDDDLKLMWGDVGSLYFWIRTQDLAARRFNNSWLCLQCC